MDKNVWYHLTLKLIIKLKDQPNTDNCKFACRRMT